MNRNDNRITKIANQITKIQRLMDRRTVRDDRQCFIQPGSFALRKNQQLQTSSVDFTHLRQIELKTIGTFNAVLKRSFCSCA